MPTMNVARRSVDRTLRFELSVPPDPISVAFVRKAVCVASEISGQETADVVGLVFTELVTNAVVHAGLGPEADIDVELVLSPDGIRGCVRDRGPGFDVEGDPQPRADGGFGLFIVQRLADRWGVERSEGRTEVWFEASPRPDPRPV